MASGCEPQFFSSERFEVVRQLGAGGMGIVYQVYDRERSRTVALKTLHQGDASALYRLKREFRALADIVHPNLATLYELVSSDGEWFLTMELIDGVDFITWVRGEEANRQREKVDTETTPQRPGLRQGLLQARRELRTERDDRESPALPEPSRPICFDRLREALCQLAEGVQVLHDAGKLHRDIKPSNVMVDQSGRVVLLDFGLITDVARPSGGMSGGSGVVGTVEYMSPEQGASLPVGPASDWYSVGMVLYHALTGILPFRGLPVSVLMEKQSREPEPPLHLVPETPADLSQLCCELLRSEPHARPCGDEILERLGSGGVLSPALRRSRDSRSPDVPLIGRRAHALALRDAFDVAVGEERATTVLVHGRSGMGKSILIERTTRSFAAEWGAVVLAGRCHERESVPYKALDGLIDSLSRFLAARPRPEVEKLMPRDTAAMARLFPVLRRVRAIAAAPRRLATSDPLEVRRRGLTALRELLARVADRCPLVLAIDDFQWGDLDSTMLLLDLLRPPDPPALLLIVAYRSEDAEESEAVRHLLEGLHSSRPKSGIVRDLEVGALGPDEARELARTLLRQDDGKSARLADALARESGGDPFVIDQLVRFLHKGTAQGAEVSFTDVMRRQLAELAPDARHALELIAVAGQPVQEQVVASAAGLAQMDRVLAVLRARSLVRRSGALELGRIETYHDRIREAVLATLSETQQRACHLALGDAIEAGDQRDAEALALHLLGGGEVARGTEYAIEAARKASAALAFERAIFFYRLAIDALPAGEVSRRRLRAALGEALVNAGRGVEAAAEYMTAADAVPAAQALELRRRAAEQLLRCGHVDEGIRLLQTVLESVGMKVARTPRRALWSFFRQRMRVRARGLRFVERDASQVSSELLTRVDVCWTAASGIGPLDPIRGLDFQSRHLLLALAAGEPYRIARALAAEGCYSAIAGRASWPRTERIIAMAGKIADRLGEPHARGLVAWARGMADYQLGQWDSARPSFEQSASILRELCTGVADQVALALRLEVDTLFQLGLLGELCWRVPHYLAEEERRGDLFGVYGMRTGFPNAVWLVADDPARARSECQRGARSSSFLLDFSFEQYHEAQAHTHIDLYVGDGPASHRRVSAMWPRLQRSKLLRMQSVRAEALFLRGRAALAAAAATFQSRERRSLLAEVDRARRQIDRQRLLVTDAQASVLAAGKARLRGEIEKAAQLLADAESRFRDAQMRQYAAAMRYRRGELTGGAAGEELRADGERAMRAEGVRNPSAWTRLFAPF